MVTVTVKNWQGLTAKKRIDRKGKGSKNFSRLGASNVAAQMLKGDGRGLASPVVPCPPIQRKNQADGAPCHRREGSASPQPLRTCFLAQGDEWILDLARSPSCKPGDGADRTGHGAPRTVSPIRFPDLCGRGAASGTTVCQARARQERGTTPPRFAVFLNSLRKAVYSLIQRRKNFVAISPSITTSLLCGLPIASVSVSEAVLCPLLSP